MADTLDLAILDANKEEAIAYGRCNSDIAVANLPLDKQFSDLHKFRLRIDRALRGIENRPPVNELTNYGHDLFNFCIRGELANLYNRLPATHVRIHILSNHPDVQAIPWEYLQEPHQNPGPPSERSIVRIVQMLGRPAPTPLQLGKQIRVLFASAEPTDQEPVSWPDVQDEIEATFRARLDRIGRFEFTAVNGATRTDLLDALTQQPCDIFHYSGHGEVDKGVGYLILTDRTTRRSVRLRADELGLILAGRDIRLVVLSACDTATGNFSNDFSVTAEAIVRAGVPAVVANQLPVPDKTVATFVAAMYRELLNNGGDIDKAVGAGRLRLAIDLGSSPEAVLEWGIPAIYRHIAAAQIFKP